MKKSLLPKRILVLFSAVFIFWQIGLGQALLVENFDYPSGALLTANGWTAHSGTTNPITVNSTGLTFIGFPGSGVGLSALLDNTGEDVSKVFTTITNNSVYCAFMINVTTVANLYCMHFGGNPIATTFRAKFFLNGTGTNFNFGLSKGSNTPTLTSGAPYTTNTTYLAVLKYTVVSGTANDEVSLYIFDNTIPAVEPGTATIGPLTDAAQSDINPGTIALRQDISTQNIVFDGIRIATSWTDAISDVYPPIPAFLPANSATDVAITATPAITFDEAVVKTDGSELTNSDLASLVTFRKTNASGENVGFSATINATKKVITITPSASLDNSQVYYLGVGAVKDASGNQSTASNVTFTTIAAATPTVTLTYPVGGEVMYAGQSATITWTSANITNLLVEVFAPNNDVDRVFDWIPFVPTTPAAAGKVDIMVPEDAPYATVYKIRISDLDNPAVISTGGDFTIISVAKSLTDLRDRCIVNDIVKLNSEVTMTFKRATGNQKYIQDAGSGLLVYDPSAILTTPLTEGDNFTGIEGKIATYNGVLEIVPTKSSVTVNSSGNTVSIPEMTIPEYNANYLQYESMLIKIKNVTFVGADGSSVFLTTTTTPPHSVTDRTNLLAFYTFKSGEGNIVGSVIPSGQYNVTALALRYNTTPEIASRTTADFEFLTGISNPSEMNIEMFPVPAASELKVRNIINVKTIDILDVTGKVVRTTNPGTDNEITIPVSELKGGIYFVRFNTKTGVVIKRFVK